MNMTYRGALVRNRKTEIDYKQYRAAVRKANLIDTLKALPWLMLIVAAYVLYLWINNGVAA